MRDPRAPSDDTNAHVTISGGADDNIMAEDLGAYANSAFNKTDVPAGFDEALVLTPGRAHLWKAAP
jgi:hypothetical protein